MSPYTYRPLYGGAYYDPAPAGGQVDTLLLYPSPGRDGVPAGTAGPAVRAGAGRYTFNLPDVPPGRYWLTVTFVPSQGAAPVTDQSVRLDLPLGLGVVTSPENVAKELGVPLPLDAEQRDDLLTAIRKAQADVVAYLRQPIVPQLVTRPALTPWAAEEDLDDVDAWPFDVDDQAQVAAYRQRDDGSYDVDFLVGLDGAANEAIVRYVTTHAAESERLRPGGVGSTGRRVSSVSAEGQSISYESAPTPGQAGALPTLDSLSQWKMRLIAKMGGPVRPPWPYTSHRGR
ncbi:hypothetical protein ACIBAC_00330 [Streptomyces sp. NPDC051362]|uniref:hypothetical protein n=1 Tax=Streptomyces sp. NPDC051362 TaxID=3365651 RepID=UPI00378ABE56